MRGKTNHRWLIVGISLILLITVASCGGCSSGLPGFNPTYALRISSTMGGTVITPGEGLFRYPKGTVVNVVAKPDVGYRFVGWVTNAAAISNSRAASTTVTVEYHSFLIARFDD